MNSGMNTARNSHTRTAAPGEQVVLTDADPGSSYRSIWGHLADTDFCQGHADVDGLRTRFIQAGRPDAPTVILLHGTGGHWETFAANLPALAEHFNCLAIDMIGCGFTDKPDRPYEIHDYVAHVLAFMDALGVGSASFIGVSLGSWVSARLALVAPERVERLVLNAPSGLLQLPEGARTAGSTARSRATTDPTWANTQAVLRHLFYDESSMIDDIVAIRQRVMSQAIHAEGAATPHTLTLFDPEVRQRNLLSEEEWQMIQAPTLIIAHVDAPDVFLTTAMRLSELIPHTAVAEIQHASHWPHFEQPDAFHAVALPFLMQGDVR